MAVDHGLQYSVAVGSKFDLFREHFANDEEADSANDVRQFQPRHEETTTTNTNTVDNSRKQRNQKSANQPPVRARGGARPNTGRPGGTEGVEHLKEEHRNQQKHPRGHVPPHRGREFDRKSGSDKTGVKSVPKKDGYGVGNWGTMEDEIEATMTENNEHFDNSREEGEEQATEPPAPPTLTLEEYKAQQKGKCIASQAVTSRTANDGKDVFKDMKLVKSNKPVIECDAPKFASVYYSPNESGIALQVSRESNTGPRDRPGTRGRGGDRRGRGGRGGFGGQERERRPRPEQEDGAPRPNRPSRGGPRGAPGSGRGAPRGAPRGARGGGPSATEKRTTVFSDNDFPALG